jgi:hypothetical protein
MDRAKLYRAVKRDVGERKWIAAALLEEVEELIECLIGVSSQIRSGEWKNGEHEIRTQIQSALSEMPDFVHTAEQFTGCYDLWSIVDVCKDIKLAKLEQHQKNGTLKDGLIDLN